MSERIGRRFVLDSQPVLAFLRGEPAARRVRDWLTSGEPWMTLVNLGEVVYVYERENGVQAANEVWTNLLSSDRPAGGSAVQWLPIDETLVRRAASLKAAGGMSYADCFAAAAAAILECPVLTGDPEFSAAERAGIAVEWL